MSINHAYEDGKFYFHCAVGGKKVDSIERNLSVMYTIIKYYGIPEDFKTGMTARREMEAIQTEVYEWER